MHQGLTDCVKVKEVTIQLPAIFMVSVIETFLYLALTLRVSEALPLHFWFCFSFGIKKGMLRGCFWHSEHQELLLNIFHYFVKEQWIQACFY